VWSSASPELAELAEDATDTAVRPAIGPDTQYVTERVEPAVASSVDADVVLARAILSSFEVPGRGYQGNRSMCGSETVLREWSNAGQLDWWVKERQEWWGRVRGADGRQRWIRAVDLRPAIGP
jgi:hypothetical protein